MAAAFLILIGTIALTLLWPSESRAVVSVGEANLLLLPSDYSSPGHCRECHAEEFRAWSGTSHAQASFDPIFQTFLQLEPQPGECFSCHTTGYDAVTGQFALAGVTCEACHGPYQEDHPGSEMTIVSAEDLCGACHMSTLAEWTSSRHGKVGVSCMACHEVHSQQTRATARTQALCVGCHQYPTQDSIHVRHREAEVRCIDCHVARPDDDDRGAVKRDAVTGHAFGVWADTCGVCHPTPLGSGPELP